MTTKDLTEMTLKYGLMCHKYVSPPSFRGYDFRVAACYTLLLSHWPSLDHSVSAASQAITTYIRNHMTRCEAQQDHPLLLRHVPSGTLADDDLVPALYSRRGGAANPIKSSPKDPGCNGKNVAQIAQGTLGGERLTNFGRDTMVWYLSKAAGVSCPFACAGIRLC